MPFGLSLEGISRWRKAGQGATAKARAKGGHMEFSTPLQPARLIRRYKRFLADAELEHGDIVTVHCPNPGAMTGLAECGQRIWLRRDAQERRKIPWSWALTETRGVLVGIDTSLPNKLVAEALERGVIEELASYPRFRREVYLAGEADGTRRRSRIDFLLDGYLYLEVKNVHLSRTPGLAEFPDTPTARGARHLAALAEAVGQGAQAAILYVVQRGDCRRFRIASDIDPAYAKAHGAALRAGVQALCYGCGVGLEGIRLTEKIPILEKRLVKRLVEYDL
jgi:sugar fermentation stimulation protein A